MKKGITPIVSIIVLLLITVALAGVAWTYLSGWITGYTGKDFQVTNPGSCIGGTTAMVTITNMGTDNIDLDDCHSDGSITGTSKQCGDIIVTRTDGGTMHAQFSAGSIAARGAGGNFHSVTFNDTCTTAGHPATCTYDFTRPGAPTPKTVTVTCSG